jgi:hypothetical protein
MMPVAIDVKVFDLEHDETLRFPKPGKKIGQFRAAVEVIAQMSRVKLGPTVYDIVGGYHEVVTEQVMSMVIFVRPTIHIMQNEFIGVTFP